MEGVFILCVKEGEKVEDLFDVEFAKFAELIFFKKGLELEDEVGDVVAFVDVAGLMIHSRITKITLKLKEQL